MTIQEIKDYMHKRHITQIQLSELSGIPLQTLRKIFAGFTENPRIDTMQAIEAALGITPADTPSTAPALAEKEKRLLEAFNKLIPAMQDYVLNSVERLTLQPHNVVKRI